MCVVNDYGSLYGFFLKEFGPTTSLKFQRVSQCRRLLKELFGDFQARLRFTQSMAAYSVFSYILQTKDRHNGNIMVDRDAHIVHIDFGLLCALLIYTF